jgi:hypothetical protein
LTDHLGPSLPEEAAWRFDEIACSDADRARTLASAGTPSALLTVIADALDEALSNSDARFGREHAEGHWEDCRAVVQFGVGAEIFDWFFNARTGYRAHFRADYVCGLKFNNKIIAVLRERLAALPTVVTGRELKSTFEDCGKSLIPRSFVLASLIPELSKVWFCTKRIQHDGGIDLLLTGVVGPRLLLEEGIRWAAPYRENDSAWLDVKGAFLGQAGPYQPKDPMGRAKKLQATGEA